LDGARYLIQPELYGCAAAPTVALICLVVALVIAVAALLGALDGAAAKRFPFAST
jgi:hypothetical protein